MHYHPFINVSNTKIVTVVKFNIFAWLLFHVVLSSHAILAIKAYINII